MLKAIETCYKGYRFRGRLEARWAVFFDTLGIRYDYEPQGYEVRAGWDEPESPSWRYLPDFHLTDWKTWVEVKPSVDVITDDYLRMLAWAVDWGGCLPDVADSYKTPCGLLILGPVPYVDPNGPLPAHPILQHSKGLYLNVLGFLGHDHEPLVATTDADFEFLFDASVLSESALRHALSMTMDGWAFLERIPPSAVADAYRAARSARFEHRESW
jgi:hypothetical protein